MAKREFGSSAAFKPNEVSTFGNTASTGIEGADAADGRKSLAALSQFAADDADPAGARQRAGRMCPA